MENSTKSKTKPYDSEVALPADIYLPTLAAAFLMDRKAQNLSKHTQRFYRVYLTEFIEWADTQAVKTVIQITPDLLRRFMLKLAETHNAGGVHAYFRTLRVFLRWYVGEWEPLEWRNPINKVKAPRVDVLPLEPVPMEVIKAMLATCDRGTFAGERDRAILLFLLDTGARAGELLALDKPDVDLLTGDVLIRKSKSRKPRRVFIGRTARKALRVYLNIREDLARALWVSAEGERLKPSGLRQIMRRRSMRAQVPAPSIHSFRRAFALAMKRAGVDLLEIARLLGHSDLSLLDRYIRMSDDSLRDSHSRASPADSL